MSGEETVLVVEDETHLAELYRDWLADDYEVLVAETAAEALDLVEKDVDILLLDRKLPDGRGEEVLSEFRERAPDCRVAMVTAVDPDFDIVDMGFDDYLIKPVTREELERTIGKLLDHQAFSEGSRKYSSLVNKRELLRAEKSDAEIESSDEFDALTDRIKELEAELDEQFENFDEEDYQAMFRDLGTDEEL